MERESHDNEDEESSQVRYQAQHGRPTHLFECLKYQAAQIGNLTKETVRKHQHDKYQVIVRFGERWSSEEERARNQQQSRP